MTQRLGPGSLPSDRKNTCQRQAKKFKLLRSGEEYSYL